MLHPSIARAAWLIAACLPLATFAAPPVLQDRAISGEVLESRDVDAYTYLRLKTAQGEVWAAVMKAPVKKGAQVTVGNASVMNGFASRTLNKTFDHIVFGSLVDPKAAPAAAAKADPKATTTAAAPAGAGALPPGHPKSEIVAMKTEPVPKATGADARTVAEVWKGKSSLKDKPVTVRARVVKVNNGIMGKNWVHVRDGSGSAADGSDDILVTTKDAASLGDVVLVKGTVRTDVKLGGGYDFAVLIEDAAVRK